MKKLILPAEVKVCATCSYWDGERTVDTELRLVVVSQDCEGECLVQTKSSQSLNDVRSETEHCVWEHLAPDSPAEDATATAELCSAPASVDGSGNRDVHRELSELIPHVASAQSLDHPVDARSMDQGGLCTLPVDPL